MMIFEKWMTSVGINLDKSRYPDILKNWFEFSFTGGEPSFGEVVGKLSQATFVEKYPMDNGYKTCRVSGTEVLGWIITDLPKSSGYLEILALESHLPAEMRVSAIATLPRTSLDVPKKLVMDPSQPLSVRVAAMYNFEPHEDIISGLILDKNQAQDLRILSMDRLEGNHPLFIHILLDDSEELFLRKYALNRIDVSHPIKERIALDKSQSSKLRSMVIYHLPQGHVLEFIASDKTESPQIRIEAIQKLEVGNVVRFKIAIDESESYDMRSEAMDDLLDDSTPVPVKLISNMSASDSILKLSMECYVEAHFYDPSGMSCLIPNRNVSDDDF